MSFLELDIKSEYRSLKDNIAREFYIPLLKRATLYKRAVGFFSSTSLAEISSGIAGLIQNGGSINLVASPNLSEEDLLAIKKGYENRDKIIEKALLTSLSEPKDYFEEARLNILANLIAAKRLDLKIAFLENNEMLGMYHEKMGLLYDKENNVIAFSGSMNDSSTAFNINYETIDVFLSWTSDLQRVKDKEKAFNNIWNNNERNIQIIDFPKVREEILKKYKKGPMDLQIDQKVLETRLTYETKDSSLKVPKLPSSLELHDYQKSAIDNWKENSFRGIFDMATGTGKTLTGLGAITTLSEDLNHELGVVIVCPYQHLVEQWVEDINYFNIEPIIGYSNSSQKDWRLRLDNAIRDYKLKVRNRKFFCFICTNATFSSTFVQDKLGKMKGNLLIVVDEAHNFGSYRLSSLLDNKYNYRLALSATLERHRDEEGTEKLVSFFGEKCIEYPLDRAIKEKKLTPYKYYPILVSLNDQELSQYKLLSHEISKCIIMDKNGRKKLSEKGEKLALKRARLVAAAKAKLDTLEKVIQPYKEDNYLLVYCGAASMLGENDEKSETFDEEIRQIDAVTDLLGNKLNMKVSQFTSKENVDEREILKKQFQHGEKLQALIAIKCLDEGVNIPKIKVAFILASTTNPKEYIQRRGRVLRLAKGKDYAEIYDFITTPRPLDEVSSLTQEEMEKDLSLIKNEIKRAKEFARISLNPLESFSVIENIMEAYYLSDDNLNNFDLA
ncbi:DEAD/DEAH box helicase family protein [Bacillus sp. FJAT-27445]|uniref:DEAD/DEAH box helicase family protein n=1 Tax=Bacillus sp. FJAT-27445 TaxID=1679166 RepID=UPI00074326BF|nr:DEAD/DEAH box helicase family protein [Bacillus sp. FJAT-27445]